MPTYTWLAPTTTTGTPSFYGCPMYGWMMGGNYGANMGAWGWFMMSGIILFGVLVLAILVLLAVWLVKRIKE